MIAVRCSWRGILAQRDAAAFRGSRETSMQGGTSRDKVQRSFALTAIHRTTRAHVRATDAAPFAELANDDQRARQASKPLDATITLDQGAGVPGGAFGADGFRMRCPPRSRIRRAPGDEVASG
ncbi:MAG: hypothetical protein ABI585_15435 [Betaproteobacteria bacterium]